MQAIAQQIKARDLMTRQAFENAIRVIMAVGGSTNAVLHLLAAAHAAAVPLTLEDFEALRAETPVLCDLKPSGRYVTVDLHRAGGIPQVMKMLLAEGLLHGDCPTISGRTIAETLQEIPPQPDPQQDVIRPIHNPLYSTGHLAVLRGNLAEEGSVAKISGVKHPVITGPAKVYGSEEECLEAILSGEIQAGDVVVIRYEGPKGGPGMREMLGAHLRHHRRWPGRQGGAHHRWALQRRHLWHGGGSCGTRSSRGRHHRPGGTGRHHHHRCTQAAVAAERV